MKISTLVLSLSLTVNAGLLAVVAFRPAEPDTPVASSAAVATAGAAAAPAVADAAGAESHVATTAGARTTWDRLQSDDLATVVARLRAAGFPPDIVRRVVSAMVRERIDARRLEIEKDRLAAPFWTNANTLNAMTDPKIGPELRKLQREQMLMVRDLLGGNFADAFLPTDEDKALLRYQLGSVPADKLDRVFDTFMDYQDKRGQLMSATAGGGSMLPADRQQLAELEKGMREDLAKFLSPAELTDFNLHFSEASQRLRMTLAAAQPTEQEFRTAFPVFQAFLEQTAGLSMQMNLPPEQAALRKQAEEQMNNQLKTLLGEARAADFQQAMNPMYMPINRLVSRLELPISAATQVVAVQQDVQQRIAALRNDNTTPFEERRAQAVAIGQEASAKIAAALGGPRGLEAYKMNGGQWLLELQPRPRPVQPKN